jgi:large subunit ribosomal protein L5
MADKAKKLTRLEKKYRDEVVAMLREKHGITNIMAVPRLKKITVNMGVGEGVQNKKLAEAMANELGVITGQKPVVTRARTAAATWKLREGDPIGCKVTLRGDRMWLFLEKLISVAVPRIRDFSGLNPNSFDGRGNYNMGLSEQTLFPDIEIDKVTHHQGMDIAFTISGGNDEFSRTLLLGLGVPLKRIEAKKPAPQAA